MKKYSTVIVIIILIVISASSFISSPPVNHEFQNLQVLPKDITEDQLDSVMDHFKASLGVKCDFCHAGGLIDSSGRRHLDLVSDAKEEKLMAREMLKMTAYINATYFNFNNSTRPDTIHTVICYTCHRGSHEPEASNLFPQLDSIMQSGHKRN